MRKEFKAFLASKANSLCEMAIGQRGDALLNTIIGVAVALTVVSLMFPIGMDFWTGATTTNWKSQTVTAWNAIPSMAAIGLIIGLIFYAVRTAQKQGEAR